MLRRLLDWWRTGRTWREIAERECQHNGVEPMCMACEREAVGGW